MSRRKRKDQKRERAERARKERIQRESRREERERRAEEKRMSGKSWLQRSRWNELFYGPPTQRALAWCVLGFLISMLLMFFIVLPAQLLSGSRSAPAVFYYVIPLFLPSFFGVFVFAILEHRRKGGPFGRGQNLKDKLDVVASKNQSMSIKDRTPDVLTIGPVLSGTVGAFACLGLSAIWYGIIFVSWLLVPNVFGKPAQQTLIELALPFALPIPFVLIGFALLSLPTTFRFDRKAERLRITNWWQKKILLLSDIRSIQVIEGQHHQECDDESGRRTVGSYTTVQINLVMSAPEFPRINISNDADRQAAAETASALSQFLDVPLDDGITLPQA